MEQLINEMLAAGESLMQILEAYMSLKIEFPDFDEHDVLFHKIQKALEIHNRRVII